MCMCVRACACVCFAVVGCVVLVCLLSLLFLCVFVRFTKHVSVIASAGLGTGAPAPTEQTRNDRPHEVGIYTPTEHHFQNLFSVS